MIFRQNGLEKRVRPGMTSALWNQFAITGNKPGISRDVVSADTPNREAHTFSIIAKFRK